MLIAISRRLARGAETPYVRLMDQKTLETVAQAVEISVNGRGITTRAGTLAALLVEQGLGEERVATALNGDFVPGRARAATPLRAGDRVEILSARQGG